MSKYFDKFPVIMYNGNPVRNILARTRLSDQTKNNPVNYVPHRLNSSMLRADIIAHKYYDSEHYDWLYYLSNEIVDPYYDVALSDEILSKKIISTYGSLAYARDCILYYRNNWVGANPITEQEYYLLPVSQQKYYTANVDYFNNVTGYSRKKIDWIVSTNKLVTVEVDTVEFAEVNDIYVQYESGNVVAKAQLVAYDSDLLTMTFKNITGAFVSTAGNTLVSKYRATQFSYVVSEVLSTSINIPIDELSYWTEVSAYDYEVEQNQKKKDIVLIRNSQKTKVEEQLTELLRS